LGVYGGYFGAGSGVMVLTLLLLVTERHLPTANALKNMLVGGMSACTAVVFTLFAGVDWTAVVPLMAGMLAGSRVGPLVTRRVPAGLMRLLIACVGLILAAELWFNPRF
ncbi:MAG TPA: sulfite exporter TauE/SafE family protein, partial [Solirubrobacteraceae bacterium]|nr:sulfite exporter TauE/SafE family protein [Solirubrobacteraceae bacterium]